MPRDVCTCLTAVCQLPQIGFRQHESASRFDRDKRKRHASPQHDFRSGHVLRDVRIVNAQRAKAERDARRCSAEKNYALEAREKFRVEQAKSRQVRQRTDRQIGELSFLL